MPTPVRQAILGEIQARLDAYSAVSGAVEIGRRAPVDIKNEVTPHVGLSITKMTPDHSAEPGNTHYTVELSVLATVAGTDDADLDNTMSVVHANIVGALAGWTPSLDGMHDAVETDVQFNTFDTEDSAKPAGEVLIDFNILMVVPYGQLYTP